MELLTVREVAAYLKTTRQQVRRMIQSGELRAIKVGREYRITLSALAEFLEESVWSDLLKKSNGLMKKPLEALLNRFQGLSSSWPPLRITIRASAPTPTTTNRSCWLPCTATERSWVSGSPLLSTASIRQPSLSNKERTDGKVGPLPVFFSSGRKKSYILWTVFDSYVNISTQLLTVLISAL